MSLLTPYLGFNGNCQKAMEFYKESIGGELQIMPMQDDPERVMHAQLDKGGFVLMGSDMLGEQAQQGNTVSLCMRCDSKEHIEEVFAKLTRHAKSKSELRVEFWGDIFGELVDQFGFRWMLLCSPQA